MGINSVCYLIDVKNVQYKVFLSSGILQRYVLSIFLSFNALLPYNCINQLKVLDKEDEENDLKIIYQKNLTEISKPETDGNMTTAFKN